MNNLVKKFVSKVRILSGLFTLAMLVFLSSPLKAQGDNWQEATSLVGGSILFNKNVNFPECYTRLPTNYNLWFNCKDKDLKAPMNWDEISPRVTKSYTFTLSQPSILTFEFETHVDKNIFYHQDPKFFLSKKGKGGKWESAWVGYTYRTNYHGSTLRYKHPYMLKYKINSDGTVKYYDQLPIYDASTYKITFNPAVFQGAYDLAYVKSRASLKVYFMERGKKNVGKSLSKKIFITAIKGDEIAIDANGGGEFNLIDQDDLPLEVLENAIIMTGMDSTVTVNFEERGKIHIKEMTNFSVRNYIIMDNGISAKTNMKVGDVDVEVDMRFKEVDFSVSTPTCVCSVRGTIFHVSHRHSPEITKICVDRGKVEVTPKLFSAKPKIVNPGECITVDNHSFGKTTSASIVFPNRKRIQASADSYVYAYNYRNWNHSNRGIYAQLRAGWHPTGGEGRAYIKFDLSNTGLGNIDKAMLKLYHIQTRG